MDASNVCDGDQFFYSSGNADTLLSQPVGDGAAGVHLAPDLAWTSRLVSPGAAWVSLWLSVFSPTFLARAASHDMAAALFFCRGGAIGSRYRLTPMTVLVAEFCRRRSFLGSAPILIPVAIVMTMVRFRCRPLTVGFRGRSEVRTYSVCHRSGVAVFDLSPDVDRASFGFVTRRLLLRRPAKMPFGRSSEPPRRGPSCRRRAGSTRAPEAHSWLRPHAVRGRARGALNG